MNARTFERPLSSPLIAAVLLVCAVFAVYVPALSAGFIWDDDVLLTDNPLLKIPGGLLQIWRGENCPDYIPLTLTIFWIETRLWGSDAAGYHFVNVALHAVSALLVWRILQKLSVPGAWLGALWFAIHPVNVASVAWIAERKNTLSAVFYFASILLFLKSIEPGQRRAFAGSLALFALALLAKGSVVVLPAILVGLVWWRKGRIARGDAVKIACFVPLAVASAWLTWKFQAAAITMEGAPESVLFKAVRAAHAFWFYLGKIVWPADLALLYPQWALDLHAPFPYVVLAAAMALAGLCLVRSRAAWAVALGCFAISLSPVLGFIRPAFMDQSPVADWWQYLAVPCITPLLGVTAARGLSAKKLSLRWAALLCATTVSVALGILTWRQSAHYESLETYSREALRKNPHAWMARITMGLVHEGRGERDLAMAEYRRALEDNPQSIDARNNLGSALLDAGQLDEALFHLNKVIERVPGHGRARNNCGAVLFKMGRLDEAIAEFRASLAVRPWNPAAQNNLGLALAGQGAYVEARQHYRAALALDPHHARAWFNLGASLAAEKQHEPAMQAFRRALAEAPALAAASIALARTLMELGRSDEAVEELERLIRIAPVLAKEPAVENALREALERKERDPQ